jgi:quinoprotein glucose dehydrogenase
MNARTTLAFGILLVACAAPVHPPTRAAAAVEWRSYGHDPGGVRFSPLTQIDRGNVSRLVRAWTYHTGELETRSDSASARDARDARRRSRRRR